MEQMLEQLKVDLFQQWPNKQGYRTMKSFKHLFFAMAVVLDLCCGTAFSIPAMPRLAGYAISGGSTMGDTGTKFTSDNSDSAIGFHFVVLYPRSYRFDRHEMRSQFEALPLAENLSLLPRSNGWFPGMSSLPVLSPLQVQPATTSVNNKPSSFLKWLGLGAFWWAAFFDHYQDAIQDNGGRPTYIFGADYRHWHYLKNLAHLGYLTTGFAAGMELGQKKVTVKRFALRFAGSVMIYWFIQNLVYDKALNNVWFDYGRKYNTDGIVVFSPTGKDYRIHLSKWSRPVLDVVRVVGGLYLVIKY